MRIIAGEFRGRTLKAPKGEGTRPTTDRVREAMMSTVHSARGGFDDAVVLDAFAGSGALGLEALSRGARSVQFCERGGEALVAEVAAGTDPFDLVFLAPPYACAAAEVLGLVVALRPRAALSDDAFVVYEHASAANDEVEEAAKARDLSIAQRKKYGDTVVDVLRATALHDAID